MNPKTEKIAKRKFAGQFVRRLFLFTLLIFASACSQLERPKSNTFFAVSSPPTIQELRWSNGKAPRSLDPSLAAAPPETDIVRAMFEGLTETDGRTLDAIPGVAEKWEPSVDFRTWTFHLRKDARWSNGKTVRAGDFVRSWKRLAGPGETLPHYNLLRNILGMERLSQAKDEAKNPDDSQAPKPPRSVDNSEPGTPVARESEVSELPENNATEEAPAKSADESRGKKDETFGVTAIDTLTLEVKLIASDPEFPKLAAHPILRPIFADGTEFAHGKPSTEIVTNGAFRLAEAGGSGLTLERSATYWNHDAVRLDRIRFIPKENASDALEAYRAGELDVVTNAEFEPLALKLLAPYEDFRRTTNAALNLYEFNFNRPPFNDRHVREALTIAIERERLTEGEMEGSTRPALRYFPFGGFPGTKLTQDAEEARRLLADAGYPDGENFPEIRLVVNRNDTQQRIARLVARMWKQNLNIATKIIVKEVGEMDATRRLGDFDLIRRGMLLPTSDARANLTALFDPERKEWFDANRPTAEPLRSADPSNANAIPQRNEIGASSAGKPNDRTQSDITGPRLFASEEQALYELPAIPLYFPTSYSLVKPYVEGFEINGLDLPLVKDVRINSNWQPQSPDQ